MDDLLRWSHDTSHTSKSNTHWLFSNCKSSRKNLTFIVASPEGEEKHTFSLHPKLVLILAYLDLDYWSHCPCVPTRNDNRLARYLGKLRDDVVEELRVAPAAKLVDPSFGTTTLRSWAARVSFGYGHSRTGRMEYNNFCAEKGLLPYADDPVVYGEWVVNGIVKDVYT